jgi:hypothetical protein
MNGNGQNDIVRLAGVWVSPKVAKSKLIGPLYGVQNLIDAIARAEPEDGMEYRKSQRSQAAYDDLVRQDKGPAATASTSGTPRPKRARRSSATPVADDASTSAGTPSASGSRVRVEATTTVTAPAGATIDMIAEIESAKKLVRDLKRELQMRAEAGEDVEETSSSRGTKRTGNTEEAANSTGAPRFAERQIATNKRVQGRGQTVKRAAFGAVLFGLGATAAMCVHIVRISLTRRWFPQIAELASNYL